jgi:citrate lyase beta subunit
LVYTSEQAIRYAKKVIQVFEKADAEGAAEIQLDSIFIDYPMVQDAMGIVSLPKMIGIYEKEGLS